MDECQTVRVSLCICTYRRETQLNGLLDVLAGQCLPSFLEEVIVVDNDREASAQPVCQQAGKNLEIPLIYVVEPCKNIAMARNLCLKHASGEWIAFIDDDERPVDNWLGLMMACAQKHGAAGVFGPVLPAYDDSVPSWIRRGGFFEKRRFATGASVPLGQTRTSNVMFEKALVADLNHSFDPAFGLSGGSDSLLFDGLLKKGAHFVWCDEAWVVEDVPVERACRRWLAQRAFRCGQNSMRIIVQEGQSRFVYRIKVLIKSSMLFVLFLLLAVLTFPLSSVISTRYLMKSSGFLGRVTALFNYVYEEYR